MSRRLTLCLLSLLFVSSIVQQTSAYKCVHDEIEKPEPIMYDEMHEEDIQTTSGRNLQQAAYPQMRLKAYFGAMTGPQAFNDYVQNSLVPPILDFFSAALQIKYPFAAPLHFSAGHTTICGIPTPAEIHAGIPYDYYWVLQTTSGQGWIANTFVCFISTASNRPYISSTQLSTDQITVPNITADPLTHEMNMLCLMHELTHGLGFSTSMYPFFKDQLGNQLSGHVTSATLDGATSTVVNVEPLTTLLKAHFGCPNITGAYMENSGSAGTDGSHFERRWFTYEAMTSGLIYQMQYSKFSLGMLQGSGWYVANYSYADPFFFGQGQGCNFLTASCSSPGFNYSGDGFCSSSSRGCSTPGRGGASCSADERSDGCRFWYPNVNYDCENPGAASFARLPSLQTFGRGQNSKCFTGTMGNSSVGTSSTTWCFKYACAGTGTSTKLYVEIGNQAIICSKAGTVNVVGMQGGIDCPDPLTFCSTVGQKVCPRNCMGRGTCVNGVCQCNSGFKGTDCALSA